MSEASEGKSGLKSFFSRELSTEARMFLAFVLMGIVLFVTPYFYKQEPAKPAPAKPAAQQTAPAAAASPAATETAAKQAEAPAAPAPTPTGAAGEQTIVIDTEVYRVTLTNRGAMIRSWVLKKYRDTAGKELELVNPAGAAKAGFPFHVIIKSNAPAADPNKAFFAVERQPDGLGVDFTFSDGRGLARKSFRFRKSSYVVDVTSEISQNGAATPHLLAWRGGFGDSTILNAPAARHSLRYTSADSKLTIEEAKAAKNGPFTTSGQFVFAGLQDTYFAAVALPAPGSSFEIQTWSDLVPLAPGGAEEAEVGAALGGDGRNQFAMFVGPKDLDVLRSVNKRLEEIVDWGWFFFIAKPLFLALHWVNDGYLRNYGWSIIVLTIFINFALFPLKITSMKSMKKMQALQPQIAAINDKYKNISMRDPRKQEQNQEVMALYQKHGVNPVGGCMPMALQIPFFIAFYKVLTVSIEMRGASWLWVTDLSQPEQLAIRVLPLTMLGTQFLMQKMTPQTSMDPAQQKVMLLMPLFLGFMFYGVSSGLVLYWLTGNLVGIAQQYFFNKTAPATVAVETAKPRKEGKK